MTRPRRFVSILGLGGLAVLTSLVHCRDVNGASIDRDDGAASDATVASPDAAVEKKRCPSPCTVPSDAGGRALCNEFGAAAEYDCASGFACCLDTRSCAAVGGTCVDLLPPEGCGQFGPPGSCPRETSASTCCLPRSDAGPSDANVTD